MPEAVQETDTTTVIPPKELSSSDKSLTGATPTPTNDVDSGEEVTTTKDEFQVEDYSKSFADDPNKQTRTPWFQKRIDQLTFEKHEANRTAQTLADQNKALLAQLESQRNGQSSVVGNDPVVHSAVAAAMGQPVVQQAAPQQQQPTQQQQVRQQPSMSEVEVQSRALALAQEISAKAVFDQSCNKIAAQGKDTYNDFDSSLKTFEMLGGIPRPVLDALVENPNGHKILYALGKDPELAANVVKMSAAKMGMELARVEAGLQKPAKQISNAGKPITPLESSSATDADPEKLSTSEWIKWREKNKKTRW